jgi:hypothetical protein
LLSVVLFLALVFAQTRSSWLGSFVGMGVMGFCLWRFVPGGRGLVAANGPWLLAFSGFALAVILTVSSPLVFGSHALPIRDRIADAFNFKGWTVRHRVVLWRAAMLMVRDSPIVGVGPAHFRSYFPLKQATFRESYTKQGFRFPPKERKAHNDYFQNAAETGIVGLGLWLWLLLVIVRAGLRAVRRSPDVEAGALAAGLLGGCAVFVVDSGFNFPFRIIPAATVFWMMAGGLVMLGAPDIAAAPAPSCVGRLGRRGVAYAAAVAGIAVFAWLALPRILADRAAAEGDRYFGSNMFEMAQEQYRRSLGHRPWQVFTIYQMGMALERSSRFDWTGRKWDAALRQFERARRLGLNDELLYGQMALLYEKKGLYAKSIEAARMSLWIYPENPDHSANLAYWYVVREENMDEALALARRAVAGSPGHPLYRWTYGLVLEKLDRSREALAELSSALPLLPRIEGGVNYEFDLKKDIARLKETTGSR